jgi:4-hydroxybutyrate CoA-transferase
MKYTSAAEAVQAIRSGDRVFIHSVAAAPQQLIREMTARSAELRDVKVIHLHTEGSAPYADPGMEPSFRHEAMFIGANVRKAVQENRADYIPVFLSEAPLLFRRGAIHLDVALIHVSPPDAHGYCSLGVSVDTSLAACEHATTIIAQVNPNMPRTHGDGFIHVSKIDYAVACDDELPVTKEHTLTEIEKQIGQHAASLVEDGATLQMGIGAIPDAVLDCLKDHKHLGIHTEMFSDGLVRLFESGAVTGEKKIIDKKQIITAFAYGTKKVYDFLHDNPLVKLRDVAYVNMPLTIYKNPKVTAINSALEIDLSGQVCADSIGNKMFSGVGGQMDFMRAAAISEGGKPIIALPSVTNKGESKIVFNLKPGAGVVTTRAHVHYVVTEYGVAELFGKNLNERARELIRIAHPDHRENLEKQYREKY